MYFTFSCYKKPILEKFHCTPYKHIDKPKILIIIKPMDESVESQFYEMIDFLLKSQCEIYVEESVFNKVKDN